eukprot:TRINITY_DN8607_c0_g2_i2.p1 TRINITY_DN8607_c0_g2~~TRINITY_DN8607_c0_g2_i2.p1  ORF type:complete len:189 (+),score=24.23 TRINITY_DN8607_c0_g2_i2:213-779(+)
MADDRIPRINIVVVGDGIVGKTCLLLRYIYNEFPDVPKIFSYHAKIFEVDGTVVQAGLWEARGSDEEESRLRPLTYMTVSVVILCYAIDSPRSLQRCRIWWIAELDQYARGIPIVLVGTKSDLHESAEGQLERVSVEEGADWAREIGAVVHLQCSALTCEGVSEVFETAIRHGLLRLASERKGACILM